MSDSKQYIGEVKIRAEMEDKISQGIKEITNDTKNLKETLEATNKALQELAGTNIKPKVDDSELDKLDKEVKKKRKISVDTDVSSTAEKKIDDLDKKIKKKSKKSTTKTKSSKKTADDKDQLDGINADKVVRSTRYGKNGKSSTSYSYTKSNGVQQNYNNNKLTSEKDTVVDLQKAYSQLNKDVTEYYSLKTKEAKGKVATEDKQYVKGRISDLVDEMSANRKYIADAKKQGFYNDELEQKALNHFRRKANGYNTYVDEKNATIKAYGNDDNTAIRQGQRSKQLSNYAGQSTDAIERARTLDATITDLEKE